MQRVTATWNGWAGAPGTSTLWFQGSSIIPATTIKPLFDAWAPYIPSSINIQVNNTGELVDPDTGKVTGTWSSAAVASTPGTGTAATLLLAQGVQLRLDTGSYRNGKHIRGRIYFIPCLAAAVSSVGTVAAGVITAMDAAAASLSSASGAQWGVYHRALYDTSVKPPVLTRNGEFLAAPTIRTQSKVAVLTSRRD
jgi:hypothetical protein